MTSGDEDRLPFLARRAREVSILIIAAVMVSAVAAAALLPEQTAPSPYFGSAAPDFTVTTVEGETIGLHDELGQGRVVLLDFMFVRCPACRISMPHLVALRENFSTEQLTMISIDIDASETEEMLKEFRDEYGATWHFAFDSGGIREMYKAEQFPSIMVVGLNGQPAWSTEGPSTAETLYSAVRILVG